MTLVRVAVAAAVWCLMMPGLADAMELKNTGVILIHGKAGGQRPLQPLAAALKQEGAIVSLPRMSWVSAYRTYDETLGEVDAAVRRARAAGARQVVLAGHSLGANIAMGYAARTGGVAAVVALAPGHRPDFIATRTGDSLDQARAMIAAGQGSTKATFLDFNQGQVFAITTSANAYVSFFDPNGPAAQAARASGVSSSILWVIGDGDRPALNDRAPYAAGTRIVLPAGHRATPKAAVRQVVEWLKGL